MWRGNRLFYADGCQAPNSWPKLGDIEPRYFASIPVQTACVVTEARAKQFDPMPTSRNSPRSPARRRVPDVRALHPALALHANTDPYQTGVGDVRRRRQSGL
jgi:hypothetical protein